MIIIQNLVITSSTLLSIKEADQLLEEDRELDVFWWLRSPGNTGFKSAAYVLGSGLIRYGGNSVDDERLAIRPALILNNLKYSSFQIGDVFELEDYKFKIISEERALCTTYIGCGAFRKDYELNNANNYEYSDAKRFVDNWFTQLELSYNKKQPEITVKDFAKILKERFSERENKAFEEYCDTPAYDLLKKEIHLSYSNAWSWAGDEIERLLKELKIE